MGSQETLFKPRGSSCGCFNVGPQPKATSQMWARRSLHASSRVLSTGCVIPLSPSMPGRLKRCLSIPWHLPRSGGVLHELHVTSTCHLLACGMLALRGPRGKALRVLGSHIPRAPKRPKQILCTYFRPLNRYYLHTWSLQVS